MIPILRNSSNNCRHSATGRASCASVSWRNVPFTPKHAACGCGSAIVKLAMNIRMAQLQRIREMIFRVITSKPRNERNREDHT